jgi:hypothetical protein
MAIPHSWLPESIHSKDFNFIQQVPEEYRLKIQPVATNSCTSLQQPFIEPSLHALASPRAKLLPLRQFSLQDGLVAQTA